MGNWLPREERKMQLLKSNNQRLGKTCGRKTTQGMYIDFLFLVWRLAMNNTETDVKQHSFLKCVLAGFKTDSTLMGVFNKFKGLPCIWPLAYSMHSCKPESRSESPQEALGLSLRRVFWNHGVGYPPICHTILALAFAHKDALHLPWFCQREGMPSQIGPTRFPSYLLFFA